VRYNPGVSEASIQQLAGTKPPPNLDQIIAQQNQRAKTVLGQNPRVATAIVANPQAATPPETFDWSKQGVVGSVKNQFYCGCCWDFASVGVFESMYAIRFGAVNLLDLSEEEVLRCNKQPTPAGVSACCGGGASCCGGWWEFDYITTNGLLGE